MLKSKKMNRIKKWNWTVFFVLICTCLIGALQNQNIETTSQALLFGLIAGICLGLPTAIITRDRS